ncbi:hypothetical protein BJ684DRAFT_17058 [Piptocephalis cylindrospora]|uniref:F-box domain-containing protein n=1 Tax=Piptocephalis cylindrospora TaxID=1907219 RepID=A0A4V1IXW3_9FUNG|nr:hypothetical protein BJ684DRAFT_17058 [Piptocephalis cylindrospora]|eukprot:RKP12459.1 hypothetical protein BJ684DRAFT_17058 [Piptocephalis cylindrospora]
MPLTFLHLPTDIHTHYLLPHLDHPQDVLAVAKTCKALHPSFTPCSPYKLEKHLDLVERLVLCLRRLRSGGGDEDPEVVEALGILRDRRFSYEAYAYLEQEWQGNPYVAALRVSSPALLYALLQHRFPFRWGDPGISANVGIGSAPPGEGEGWAENPVWVQASMAMSARAERQVTRLALSGDMDGLVRVMRHPWSFRVNFLSLDLISSMRAILDRPQGSAAPPSLSLEFILSELKGSEAGHMIYDSLLCAATLAMDPVSMDRILCERRCTPLHGLDTACSILARRAVSFPSLTLPTPSLVQAMESLVVRIPCPGEGVTVNGVDTAMFYLCGPGIPDDRIPLLETLLLSGKASIHLLEHAMYVECHSRPRLRVLSALLSRSRGSYGPSSLCLKRCKELVRRLDLDIKGEAQVMEILDDALYALEDQSDPWQGGGI